MITKQNLTTTDLRHIHNYEPVTWGNAVNPPVKASWLLMYSQV